MSDFDALLDKIAALPKEERTYETVIRPMALYDCKAGWPTEPASFLKYVSTDKAIRDASVEGEKKLSVRRHTNVFPLTP